MARLLDKRLVFVTGKGGAGKTTVAAAIGLAAARRGMRTIVCEVAQQERVSRAFRREGVGFEEAELAPGLSAISIDPELALEEYLRVQVGSRRLADLLFSNRFFHYFAAAAPGAKELVTIGKIWELAQLERPWGGARTLYDLVVVDAPATGHGLGILRTPRTFRDIARVGPIRRQADRIDSFIRDADRTAVVVAALPEEMPVNETLEFRSSLKREMSLDVDLVVVNALYPERFSGAEAERLARADGDLGPAARAALRAAASERNRARAQRVQLRRLRRDVDDVATLPFLFRPELGMDEFERLSRTLERSL